jgi:hypothetical protein
MEQVILLNNLFSTADAEDIEYSSDGYEFKLNFTNWQGNRFALKFNDLVYLKITEYVNDEKFNYDSAQEVLNSGLIKELKLDKENYHHYMLCFNAWSNVEVISNELIVAP